MKITLTNDFHNTETTITAQNGRLTREQVKRARRKLCGIKSCTCGDAAGCRPQQVEERGDGSAAIIDE